MCGKHSTWKPTSCFLLRSVLTKGLGIPISPRFSVSGLFKYWALPYCYLQAIGYDLSFTRNSARGEMKLRGTRECFGLWCITQARVFPSFPSSPADVFALLGFLFLESSAGISLDLNSCKYGSTEVSCIVQNHSHGMKMLFSFMLRTELKCEFPGLCAF